MNYFIKHVVVIISWLLAIFLAPLFFVAYLGNITRFIIVLIAFWCGMGAWYLARRSHVRLVKILYGCLTGVWMIAAVEITLAAQ